MKFKMRKVVCDSGTIEFRIVVSMEQEEAEGAIKICDDPHLGLDFHRSVSQESPGVKADQILCWLRILIYWVNLWGMREEEWVRDHLVRIGQAKQRRKPRKRKKRNRR